MAMSANMEKSQGPYKTWLSEAITAFLTVQSSFKRGTEIPLQAGAVRSLQGTVLGERTLPLCSAQPVHLLMAALPLRLHP